jgi:hypothetical protein
LYLCQRVAHFSVCYLYFLRCPPTSATNPNSKAANVAKQVSDVDDNDAALAQPTQSQRVPTLPTKNTLLAQKKGITAFKRA